MAVKVIVPNKHYNEQYFGVQFKDGVAVFEDEKLAKSVSNRLGYRIEPIKENKPDKTVKPDKEKKPAAKPKKKATAKKTQKEG